MLSFTCDYCKESYPVYIDRVNGRVFHVRKHAEEFPDVKYLSLMGWVKTENKPCPRCEGKARTAYEETLKRQ